MPSIWFLNVFAMPPSRQSFLSNSLSLSPAKKKFPTSPCELRKLQAVPDGQQSFKSNSEHAKFLLAGFKDGSIPLSATPVQIRQFFSFLHQYKISSIRQWVYKARREVKNVQRLDDASVASTSSASVPNEISATATNTTATPNAAAASRRSSSSKAAMTMDEDPDEDDFSVNSEELFVSTIILPHFVAPWQNDDVDDRLTVVVWMPSGGYKWSLKLLPCLDKLQIRIWWPKTFTADNVCQYWKGGSIVDSNLRSHGIKKAYSAMVKKAATRNVEDFFIDLPQKVEEREPVTDFREFKADFTELGTHYKNLKPNFALFYDRFMTIDMKVPSTNYSRNNEKSHALFIDCDLSSVESSEV